jgi:predicted HTH transcriptional regulator
MNKARIRQLIQNGEGLSVEFKECRNRLNKNLFQTICAFLNRNGGDILLGVGDRGNITGIDACPVLSGKRPENQFKGSHIQRSGCQYADSQRISKCLPGQIHY